jgi:hypothetical protein
MCQFALGKLRPKSERERMAAPNNPPQHAYQCDWCGETDTAAKGWKWLKDKGSAADAIVICAPCLKELTPRWNSKAKAAA